MAKIKLRGKSGITGKVSWVLTGPDGEIKQKGSTHNLVV